MNEKDIKKFVNSLDQYGLKEVLRVVNNMLIPIEDKKEIMYRVVRKEFENYESNR